jgi:hypothetical protein
MSRMIPHLLLVATLTIAASDAAAATEYIRDGDFSQGPFKRNEVAIDVHISSISHASDSGDPPLFWTIEVAPEKDILWVEGGNQFIPAPDGQKFLDLTGLTDTQPFGGVRQSISGLVPGHTYQVSLNLGTNTDRDEFAGPIAVEVRVESGSTTVTHPCQSNPSKDTHVHWEPCTFKFVANAPDTAIHITGTQGKRFIGLDDVSMTYVSPIPDWVRQFVVVILILAVGLIAWLLFLLGRSKRRIAS